MSLRIGIVDFLNTRPLAWGLRTEAAPEGIQPVYASPARLAEMLAADELDVGLVPIIETARIPGVRILSDTCIAALREVRSVLLLSRRPIAQVRGVALDENSRTSAALVRVLAAERWGIEPTFTTHTADLRTMLEEADAALLIGDPALEVDRNGLQVWDLAAEWRAMTGLPFVFAVWAGRGTLEIDPSQESIFADSLEAGMAHLDEIVEQCHVETGLPADLLRRYFTHHLHYRLGPDEHRGMQTFLHLAAKHGLV